MFLREIVGTDGHFTVDEITDQLRNMIVARFGTILASSGIPVLDLAANYEQLGQFVHGRIAPEFANYGLELLQILVENVSLPPEVEQALDRRTSMGVVGDLVEVRAVPGGRGDARRGRQPGRRRAGDRDDGRHGHGPAGGPVGAARPPAAPPPPAPPPCRRTAYHVAVDGKPTGPFPLAQLRAQAASRRADPRHRWSGRQGMAGWQPAGEVAELAAALRRRAAAGAGRRLSPCTPDPGAGCGPRRTSGPGRASRVSSPQLRQFPCEQCGAILTYAPGTSRAGLRLLRPPQPDRRDAGRDRRAGARPGPARGRRRGAAERARSRPSARSCGADFTFAPPRFAGACPFCGQPVVADPGALPADPPDRAAAVPDRRPGGAPAGRRLAEGPVVRAVRHVRAGARPRPAARRLPALLDLRQPHPHRAMSAGAATSTTRPSMSTRSSTGAASARRVQVPKVRWRPARGQVGRDFDDVLVLAGEHAAGPSGRGARALGPGRACARSRRTI